MTSTKTPTVILGETPYFEAKIRPFSRGWGSPSGCTIVQRAKSASGGDIAVYLEGGLWYVSRWADWCRFAEGEISYERFCEVTDAWDVEMGDDEIFRGEFGPEN